MIKQLTAAIAATTLMAGAANAASISFADFAANNEGGIQNISTITFGTTEILFVAGNDIISISADGGDADGLNFFPYFDDISDDLPAGLGVCRALNGPAGVGDTGAECTQPGDDSVDGDFQLNEFIALDFVGSYDLRGISFRDGAHNPINDSQGLVRFLFVSADNLVSIDEVTTFADIVARAIAGEFVNAGNVVFQYVNTEFYIESISDIPVPGALPLLISGLAGLGFATRKKKKAA